MFLSCKKEIVTNTTSTQCTVSSLDAVQTNVEKASASPIQAPFPTQCHQTLISNSQPTGGKNNKQPTQLLSTEPILKPNNNRFVLYPIKHYNIWKMYKKALASFWVPEEIDFSHDIDDWNNLNDDEKRFLSLILAFFAASDGIVNENLASNFATEVQYPEARCFYGLQIAMENIHSETYSLIIDTYIKNNKTKTHLLNAIDTIPSIHQKAKWALKWCNPDTASFPERCIAFAAVEGIFFSGSFCAIFWIKQQGKLHGLAHANEFISRDEGLHCDFACLIYNQLVNKLTYKTISKIITSAVEIESLFVKAALPKNLLGMNAKMMQEYIEFCADRMMVALNLKKIYHTSNPFPWMTMISLQGKSNFFEKKVSEYALSKVTTENQGNNFCLDTDF